MEGEEGERKGKKRKIGNHVSGGGQVMAKAVGVEEKKQENGKKRAPFRVNGIQKPSPIIFPRHASETDLIKMA